MALPTYSNKSNANRAAKALVAKHDNLEVADPVSTVDGQAYYAAVYVTIGAAAKEVKEVARIADKPRTSAEPVSESNARAEATVVNGGKVPSDVTIKDNGDGTMTAKSKKTDLRTVLPKEVEKVRQKNITKAAKALDPAKPPRVTKTSQALDLMRREGGVTAQHLIDELGWKPHTLRGFVSLQNSNEKRGIITDRKDGVTSYIIKTGE